MGAGLAGNGRDCINFWSLVVVRTLVGVGLVLGALVVVVLSTFLMADWVGSFLACGSLSPANVWQREFVLSVSFTSCFCFSVSGLVLIRSRNGFVERFPGIEAFVGGTFGANVVLELLPGIIPGVAKEEGRTVVVAVEKLAL